MKQLIISIILSASVFAACNKQHTPDAAHASYISVIDDITDTFTLHPAVDPILSLYDFQSDKDQAAVFRLVLITDKKLNPVEEIHIDDGTTTEQNNTKDEIDYREQLVYSFYDDIRHVVKDFHTRYANSSPLKHSECFATISNELSLLTKRKGNQRTLIVFSDLQENTDVFTCYSESGQYLLQTNPGKVARLLQKRCPLPDNLQGIAVYFVYDPLDRNQDTKFGEMANIYKQLLHARGARVVIQATNKYYLP